MFTRLINSINGDKQWTDSPTGLAGTDQVDAFKFESASTLYSCKQIVLNGISQHFAQWLQDLHNAEVFTEACFHRNV